MIKQAIIKFRTRRNFNKQPDQPIVDFKYAEKIAILHSSEFADEQTISKLIYDIESQGKEVHSMAFVADWDKKYGLPYYRDNDIAASGALHKREIGFFLSPKYDFAILLDNSSSYLLDYIFSQIDTRCRVGNFNPDRAHFLELMIQCDPSKAQIGSEILRYLNMTQV